MTNTPLNPPDAAQTALRNRGDWRARLRDEGRREDRGHALALIEEVAHQLGSMFDPFFDGGDEDEAEAHRRVRFGLAGDLLEALALLDEAGEGRR